MENQTLAAVILVVVLGFFWYQNWEGKNRRNTELRAAQRKYQKALERLKEMPNNSEQRQATLLAGRQYARLIRESGSETLFDEVALLNDMNAVAGQQVAPGGSEPPAMSYEERLARLQKLAAEGHLTKEEYVEARKRLLHEL